MVNKEVFNRIEGLSQEFLDFVDEVRKLQIKVFGFGNVINSEEYMHRYHRGFRAIAIAQNAQRVLMQAPERFSQTRDNFVGNLQPLDAQLATVVGNLRVPTQEESALLRYLLSRLSTREGLSQIRGNKDHFIAELRKYHDKKSVYELERLLTILSGEELIYLEQFKEDVWAWDNYDPLECTKRLSLFLKGGTLDGRDIKGLASELKDVGLSKRIYADPRIKALWEYLKHVRLTQFFEQLSRTLKTAINRPGWEGFLGKDGIYHNLRHGKKYIDRVREAYGSIEFARFLEKLEGVHHQDLNRWIEEFERVERGESPDLRLFDPKFNRENWYQNFIAPAMIALVGRNRQIPGGIIGERIREIPQEQKNAINRFRSILNKRLEEIETKEPSAVRVLNKALRNRRRRHLREINNMRIEFHRLELELLPVLNGLEMGIGKITKALGALENKAKSLYLSLLQEAGVAVNERPLIAATGTGDNTLRNLGRIFDIENHFEKLEHHQHSVRLNTLRQVRTGRMDIEETLQSGKDDLQACQKIVEFIESKKDLFLIDFTNLPESEVTTHAA